ncbi:catalytic protein [Pochonia chlamydosporia 170]|uniref:Catalytic protein n=1 Tax=Pochonia chlamydosporia 170 TaxID=1380566 RepID=A0A179FGN2_METCM|nr:catalytic protein [Pochonia chlamydosporia 170]OAQ64567.1 catalytic protein [Pochonia chlamydosporia 170]
MPSPPPLPPRSPSYLSPYSHANTLLHTSDPRISSTQSLVPSETSLTKRKLLIIYIHGFYGNDQSFKSFPAHVHALLKELLFDTHVIHSKIYPRYKTYKAIEVARDNFSAWLEPHEGDGTDVVLVGHSMGGLLAADVIMMPNTRPYKQQKFKHRILGTIALDSPFLGLHPGIVVSGIASLFQPSPKLEDQPQSETHSLGRPPGSDASSSFYAQSSIDSEIDLADVETYTRPQRQPNDPHFDPPYPNDAPFREKSFVKRLINFTTKHKREGLFNAVGKHILSHLEFGGCLADYRGLNLRYNRLRALEDVDEIKAMVEGHPAGAYARVRFVNYYTLSPGRPKAAKAEDVATQGTEATSDWAELQLAELDIQDTHAEPSVADTEISDTPEKRVDESIEFEEENPAPQTTDGPGVNSSPDSQDQPEGELSPLNTPNLSTDEHDTRPISMQDIEPIPLTESETLESQSQDATVTDDLDLPPIPDLPRKPTLPDLDATLDKDAKHQAEKETRRIEKAYTQAVKDRAKAIQEREKLLEKRRKRAAKDAEKQAKEAERLRLKQVKEDEKRRIREEDRPSESVSSEVTQPNQDGSEEGKKPKKLKKFCTLPSKREGARDPTWVDVYMDGMDEVGAHCGLFFSGPHYDKLVGDVGSRIAQWVEDDLTKRAILEVD